MGVPTIFDLCVPRDDVLDGGDGNDTFVAGASVSTVYIWDFHGGPGASDRIGVQGTLLFQTTSGGNRNLVIQNSAGQLSTVVVVGVTSILAEDIFAAS